MIVPFAVSGFPIIASSISAGRETQRALNFTVPVSGCDDYQVISTHESRYYWTLLCFGYAENNKKLMSFHQLNSAIIPSFSSEHTGFKKAPKSEPPSAILLLPSLRIWSFGSRGGSEVTRR